MLFYIFAVAYPLTQIRLRFLVPMQTQQREEYIVYDSCGIIQIGDSLAQADDLQGCDDGTVEGSSIST